MLGEAQLGQEQGRVGELLPRPKAPFHRIAGPLYKLKQKFRQQQPKWWGLGQ